jgi:hypothetical protein
MKQWFLKLSIGRQYAVAIGVIVVVVIPVGAFGSAAEPTHKSKGETASAKKHNDLPAGAQKGTWDGECEAGFLNECDDESARHKLKPVEVYCLWSDRDVVVHVKLKSEFNARLQISVVPRYVIKDGGQHGTSAGSERTMPVAAQGVVTFDINAGHPIGVPAGTEISECKPKLYNVKLTN